MSAAASMKSATFMKSSSLNPREVNAGAPTYSNAAGIQGALVLGRRVLVESDVAEFTNAFESRAVQTFAFQVDQHQMIVRATRDEIKFEFEKTVGKSLGIPQHLSLILSEHGRIGLTESDGDATNRVHVRTALQSREECLIDSLGQIVHDGFSGLLFQFSHALPVEDQTRSGAPKRFVRSAGDDVAVVKRVGVHLGCNESSHVSHVG